MITNFNAANYYFSISSNIPQKFNYIWLTPPEAPKELFPLDHGGKIDRNFDVMYHNKIIVYPYWEHVLWTNNKNLIPNTVEKLENIGFEVKELKDINSTRTNIIDTISNYFCSKYAAVFIDTAKLIAAEGEGGIVADINFRFFKPYEEKQLKNDYIVYWHGSQFENAMTTSAPNHPVVTKTLDNLENSFDELTFFNKLTCSSNKYINLFEKIMQYTNLFQETILTNHNYVWQQLKNNFASQRRESVGFIASCKDPSNRDIDSIKWVDRCKYYEGITGISNDDGICGDTKELSWQHV